MEGITSSLPASLGSAEGAMGIALLKKSQDMMASQASALLATLPPARPLPPGPPGVGGHLDVLA
jgi:hypothetical protein